MESATEQLKKSRALFCLECGKCTAVCPISKFNNSYSPRRLLAEGLFYDAGNLVSDRLLWSCLTCQLCSQRCPVDVHYSEYMRDVRMIAHRLGREGNPSHGGALHQVMEMSAAPKLKQKRTGWITKSLKTVKKGEVLYFVGCLPYYQELFGKDFKFSPTDIAVDTVRILNYLGIEPVVMADERCCGHDMYWLGRMEVFDELGRLNLELIKKTGAKTIITSCPECAHAVGSLYKERLGETGLTVKHITEIVAENIEKFDFNDVTMEAAFQDPCRLGRYMGIYDQPRQALAAIPGVNFHEMAHSRRGAICCGTTNWMNCDATSKRIQQSRLKEARAAGAKTMVTACPKCQIHFRCTGCGEEIDRVDIEVTDFVNVVASALKG